MHSSKQLDCFRHRPLARLFVCDIRLDNLRNPAFRVNHSFRLQRPFEVVVEKGDLGSVAGEQYCGCSAVANLALR